ncbi:MAG: quinone-dependent dihydroorotate dehydrogenase [Albidovulum sp.]|nr:quinone-dependent dihydroorotate dehydrogenase [Albidovulum sp.]MDE0530304.1 quinone-dependent dihydroorotate dehydrogenase [Albidovulum sp.]
MEWLYKTSLFALRALEPEHRRTLGIFALRHGMPLPYTPELPRLSTKFAALEFPNPVGLAAGFDKNAVVFGRLLKAGFGFVEVGAATPEPQEGNPRPRLFELSEDEACINRFGFNNDGMRAIAKRLKNRNRPGIVGINIGANSDSGDFADDYCRVLACCGPFADFATVNVSSPNTPGLQELQRSRELKMLLARVLATRDGLPRRIPIFLKVSPDLRYGALEEIAQACVESKIDGLIATNTTTRRSDLKSKYASERGGLSGKPLFERSTRTLASLYRLTDGKIPLLGVGGVFSAEDAYNKIAAGASAVQIYSAISFHGLPLLVRIVQGLDEILESKGLNSVCQAVGTENSNWV